MNPLHKKTDDCCADPGGSMHGGAAGGGCRGEMGAPRPARANAHDVKVAIPVDSWNRGPLPMGGGGCNDGHGGDR